MRQSYIRARKRKRFVNICQISVTFKRKKTKEPTTYWMCLSFQAALRDSQVELETYKQTRQGLDEMYNVVWTQYKEEKRIRQVCIQGSNICLVSWGGRLKLSVT